MGKEYEMTEEEYQSIKTNVMKSHELARLLLETENMDVAFEHELELLTPPGEDRPLCPSRIHVPVKKIEESSYGVILS